MLGRFGTSMALGLEQILGRDGRIEVIARAASAAELERVVAASAPDVALLNGQSAASRQLVTRLLSLHPALRIIALANDPSRSYALRLLSYGVAACISSDAPESDVLGAVQLTLEGKQLIACGASVDGVAAMSEVSTLTPREAEILTHLQADATNAEIASLLHISVETVRSHASSIYRKLQVRGRRELPRLGE